MIAVKTGKQVEFSPSLLEKINEIISRYPEGKSKSAILPILHISQNEFGGYLSAEAMDYVARMLHIQPIEVYEVATFYTMFHLKPTGTYVLEVCQTGPCCLMGAEKSIAYLENKLGIKVGETTHDGLFTLRPVECLASCGSAPMMQVGDDYYENLTESSLDSILETLKKKKPV